MAYDKLILIDFETTGLNPMRHEIIEIGAICCLADASMEILWEHDQKILPVDLDGADARALEINGYNQLDWSDALPLQPGFEAFVCKLDNTMVMAGQNVWFDLGFFRRALDLCGLKDPLDYHHLDLASMVFPFLGDTPELSLSKTAPQFGIAAEPAVHRAINGARSAYALLKEIRRCGAEWRHYRSYAGALNVQG